MRSVCSAAHGREALHGARVELLRHFERRARDRGGREPLLDVARYLSRCASSRAPCPRVHSLLQPGHVVLQEVEHALLLGDQAQRARSRKDRRSRRCARTSRTDRPRPMFGWFAPRYGDQRAAAPAPRCGRRTRATETGVAAPTRFAMYWSTEMRSAQPAGPPAPVKLPASERAAGQYRARALHVRDRLACSSLGTPSSSSTVEFMCTPSSTSSFCLKVLERRQDRAQRERRFVALEGREELLRERCRSPRRSR